MSILSSASLPSLPPPPFPVSILTSPFPRLTSFNSARLIASVSPKLLSSAYLKFTSSAFPQLISVSPKLTSSVFPLLISVSPKPTSSTFPRFLSFVFPQLPSSPFPRILSFVSLRFTFVFLQPIFSVSPRLIFFLFQVAVFISFFFLAQLAI